MRPLHVALVHRASWYRQEPRIDGQFAYPVPEFTWEHFNVGKEFVFNVNDLKGFDLVWWDDGKFRKPRFVPAPGVCKRRIPVAYYVLYPTLAEHIYNTKLEYARRNADLVLLDHDRLKRWNGQPFVARRCAYSVNDKLYYDRGYERDHDVGFYCIWHMAPERPALDAWLESFCKRKGWVYGSNRGHPLKMEYADRLARCKVVVHMNRTSQTRPPRIFDVSASRAALCSSPMPDVSGEKWAPDETYVPFTTPPVYGYSQKPVSLTYTDKDCQGLIAALEWLLDAGHWGKVAENAYQYVMKHHTWAARATELRRTLSEVFPL